MPISTENETIQFQTVQLLQGENVPIQLGRRNGRLAPLFSPQMLDPYEPKQQTSRDLYRLVRELMYALNRTQRRTWLMLLLGYSILDIAREEGVSRPAIYARIRGDSKRSLGMIGKNDYVRIWWSNRGRQDQITSTL